MSGDEDTGSPPAGKASTMLQGRAEVDDVRPPPSGASKAGSPLEGKADDSSKPRGGPPSNPTHHCTARAAPKPCDAKLPKGLERRIVRVVFAEVSNAGDPEELRAMLAVIYNRVDNKGFGGGKLKDAGQVLDHTYQGSDGTSHYEFNALDNDGSPQYRLAGSQLTAGKACDKLKAAIAAADEINSPKTVPPDYGKFTFWGAKNGVTNFDPKKGDQVIGGSVFGSHQFSYRSKKKGKGKGKKK